MVKSHADVPSVDAFAKIPVLHEGRIMPMDSYARQHLLMVSGKSKVNGRSASAWLARCLFDPASAQRDEIFLVNHQEVAEAIGLPAFAGRKRFSFATLEPVLPRLEQLARAAHQREERTRSPVEQELVRLYASAVRIYQLQNAFTVLLPHRDLKIADARLIQELGMQADAGAQSLFNLLEHDNERIRLVEQHRETPRTEWTSFEAELFRINAEFKARLRSIAPAGPACLSQHDQADDPPLATASEVFAKIAAGVTKLSAEFVALERMATAYRGGHQGTFNAEAQVLYDSGIKAFPEVTTNLKRERTYNRIQPFYRAELLYGLGFLTVLISLLLPRRGLTVTSGVLVILALLPHTYGIVARMQIMGRPPVTNLFSTFIFVAWVCAVLGLVLEGLQRNRLGLLTASFCGLALLLVSGRFASEGDTLGVMVAVLDSNFWLATHVVCISLGYAGCCVAGLLGHIYLIQACRYPPDDARLDATLRAVYGTLAFGLIFSFFGTMLGGIWADQSWGRFWGWDPKENGALVIVLWSAILFHARLGGMIKARGFAAGAVIGVIGVMLAWLGVNLLGVGLHAYGFTSHLARTLIVACTFEALFVLITVPFVKRTPKA
ncbi:MAG: ABC-type transport system involved in cytochrome c biogenesis permease subunit [Kiritimatiellia bacterium]|jgi:ABC-type transport system involved in cytochrome c biogenesis permease subunit